MVESTNDDVAFGITATGPTGTVTTVAFVRVSAARLRQFTYTVAVAVGQSPKNLLGLVEAAGNQSAATVAVASALGFPASNLTREENQVLSQLIIDALVSLRPVAIAGYYNFYL